VPMNLGAAGKAMAEVSTAPAPQDLEEPSTAGQDQENAPDRV
jgi:hypothetical protein